MLVRSAASTREFFITCNGPLDLGLDDTMVDDQVMVLHGSAVPFVVRYGGTLNFLPEYGDKPKDHTFCSAVDCNVHGIVDGEAHTAAYDKNVWNNCTILLKH